MKTLPLTRFVRDLSIHDQEGSEHLQWETGSSYLKSFNPVYLHLGRQVKATLRGMYVCVCFITYRLYILVNLIAFKKIKLSHL